LVEKQSIGSSSPTSTLDKKTSGEKSEATCIHCCQNLYHLSLFGILPNQFSSPAEGNQIIRLFLFSVGEQGGEICSSPPVRSALEKEH